MASVLQTVKIIQARIEDTERAFHRGALERDDLDSQLRAERNERQRLQQLFGEEQDERRVLAAQVTKLQAAVEDSVASTAAAHRQIADVPRALERLENEVRLCARVEETQGWLGEQERRLSERLNATAGTLDEYHQDFAATSGALAEALKSKQFKLMALSDAQTKSETALHELGLELAAVRSANTDTIRSVTEASAEARKQVDERCDRLNGRADGLVGTITDLNAALRCVFLPLSQFVEFTKRKLALDEVEAGIFLIGRCGSLLYTQGAAGCGCGQDQVNNRRGCCQGAGKGQ